MKQETNSPPSNRLHQWCEFTAIIAAACMLLFLLDIPYSAALRRAQFSREIVDIQTKSIMDAKLDYLRQYKGLKVALTGDSLIFGRSLEAHGDPNWRAHGLSAQLQQSLDQTLSGRKPFVMNLGMDGMIPADMDRVVREIVPCRVDLLILDLNLRSFSADFAKPEEMLTRDWIRAGAEAKFGGFADAMGFSTKVESMARALMVRVWRLYDSRELVQSTLLDGSPKEYLRRASENLRKRLGGEASEGDNDMGGVVLLMKSKNRYKSINLDPGNPQRQALERMMAYLIEKKQKTIVFYARESPKQIVQVIPKDRYDALRRQLEDVLHPYLGQYIVYMPGAEALQESNYLDPVHVDREGYGILLKYLGPKIDEILLNKG